MKHTLSQNLSSSAYVLAMVLLLPLSASANPLKGAIDALYRPVDSRLLILRTLLPPRRDAQGNEQSPQSDCPDKVMIASPEQKRGGTIHNFAPRVHIDGPIVINCR